MKTKAKTRAKTIVRSYTADWNHLRLVAVYSDGKLIVGLRANGVVTVGGNVLPGECFPVKLRKLLEQRVLDSWSRTEVLRELFQMADSSTSFWELHGKITGQKA